MARGTRSPWACCEPGADRRGALARAHALRGGASASSCSARRPRETLARPGRAGRQARPHPQLERSRPVPARRTPTRASAREHGLAGQVRRRLRRRHGRGQRPRPARRRDGRPAARRRTRASPSSRRRRQRAAAPRGACARARPRQLLFLPPRRQGAGRRPGRRRRRRARRSSPTTRPSDATSPNKFFDGLAAGKPVVVNVDGWLRRLVEDERAGLYVPAGDPRGAGRRAGRARQRARAAAQRMGANARRLAEREFDRDDMAERLPAPRSKRRPAPGADGTDVPAAEAAPLPHARPRPDDRPERPAARGGGRALLLRPPRQAPLRSRRRRRRHPAGRAASGRPGSRRLRHERPARPVRCRSASAATARPSASTSSAP